MSLKSIKEVLGILLSMAQKQRKKEELVKGFLRSGLKDLRDKHRKIIMEPGILKNQPCCIFYVS